MNRFWSFWQQRLFQKRGVVEQVIVDLGSHRTKVFLTQSKRVLQVPTAVAVLSTSGEVVATGSAALRLVGKTSPQVEVVFPVVNGVVREPGLVIALLQEIFNQSRLIALELTTAVRQSPVHQQALERSCQQQGWMLAPTPVLVLRKQQWLKSQRLVGADSAILDIGADTTTLALIAADQLVAQAQIPLGVHNLVKEVQYLIRTQHQLDVSYVEAQLLLTTVGGVGLTTIDKKMVIRGKNAITFLPQTQTVSWALVAPAIDAQFERILTQLQQVLETASAEYLQIFSEQGICLTGGGSQLVGVAQQVERFFHCPTRTSTQPFCDGVLPC